MEKLVINYLQIKSAKEQEENFLTELNKFNKNGKHSIKLGKEYLEKFGKPVTKEYPETLFFNMTSIEEVYEFLKMEILENNYVTFDFVEIPNGFCNLKSYDFKCSLNDSNNTSEEKMNNFISWLVTHTQLHESQKFIYFLKVKNN